MITTYKEEYGPSQYNNTGEQLRIGWASWDDNTFQYRSIKYVYLDTSGKISRGCPELPFDILVDMVIAANQQGELSEGDIEKIKKAFTDK
jgi:hypothetical protein